MPPLGKWPCIKPKFINTQHDALAAEPPQLRVEILDCLKNIPVLDYECSPLTGNHSIHASSADKAEAWRLPTVCCCLVCFNVSVYVKQKKLMGCG